MLEAVNELIPLIDPVLPSTSTFEFAAVPATAPDKYAASLPTTEPAIVIEFKAPIDVM